MNKTEKLISKFFKPYFDKYPELESLSFNMYRLDNGYISISEGDGVTINGKYENEYRDKEMYDKHNSIGTVIETLNSIYNSEKDVIIKGKIDTASVALDRIYDEYREKSETHPLLKTLDEVFYYNQKELESLIQCASRSYPWKYLEVITIQVNRNGSVNSILQYDERY